MTNKCSNCGFEYGEYDVYCSRCGQKIQDSADITVTAQKVYENYINNDDFQTRNDKMNLEFFERINNYKGNIFDAFAVMFLISIALTVFLILLANKQTNVKQYLEFKNLISRPTQIPILKNTESIEEMSQNLKSNERFLKLYLTYSKDDNEKKESIFYNYLAELNKISNITNETLASNIMPECENIKSNTILKKCFTYFKSEFKNTSAKPYIYNNVIFLTQDKKFVNDNYSKYLSQDMKSLLKLQSKYNKPTSYNGIILQKPSYIMDKITNFEHLFNIQTNAKIKDIIEQNLYKDVKTIVFSRAMYDTTTQEMQQTYKSTFDKFILRNKHSALNSLFMNYMDKQKNYTEDNFSKDYPYKIYDDSFDENVLNSTFKDIFAQLRKNLALNSESVNFAYVYNFIDGKWFRYKTGIELNSNNYIISYPDENNNVTFYNFAYSPIQEMNIQDNTTLFISSGQIYTYNYDKLSFSKITYNGKLFNTKNLNYTDITTMFPGINIINLDSTNGYQIFVEKVNKNANFIILSRYAQGLKDYELTAISGDIKKMTLSNMFSVNSNDEIILSFAKKNQKQEETEDFHNYTIHITTIGQQKNQSQSRPVELTTEDNNKVSNEDEIEPHTPTIKPKITTDESDALVLPPAKNLEPLIDEE